MKTDKQKFFPGVLELFPSLICKAACRVSKSIPLSEAMEQFNLTSEQIKANYKTFRVDNTTFVQL